VGEYLATTLFGSSALAVGCEALRNARQAFGQNADMCALTEQVIFTEPYCVASNNHWTEPQLDAEAAALRGDAELKSAICSLKVGFGWSSLTSYDVVQRNKRGICNVADGVKDGTGMTCDSMRGGVVMW